MLGLGRGGQAAAGIISPSMPLTAGTLIATYEILGPIGAGGMGEVYRARDARLDRHVAIKILPELCALDPDRVARFEREAKTLAALNHPNIAQIYGLIGPADAGLPGNPSTSALVMELVDGEDLARRLARGPVPLDEAVAIARQVADALEAAHEQGIIHRDLKPGNVMLRLDGTAKVLDFGLAKALAPESPVTTPDQMNSPTFTSPPGLRPGTEAGLILGTAAYMSPEQAKGKPVDRRADIWAFGVILHEMLTGTKLWVGETAAETLAHVITRDVDLAALRPSVPPRLRTLIARCLVKDPKSRLRDIGEARVALGEMLSGQMDVPGLMPARQARAGFASRLPWGIAILAAIAAIAFAVLWTRSPEPQRQPPLRASIEPPADKSFAGSFALSPDGTRLVFSAAGREDRHSLLWIQELATGSAAPIRNTDGGERPFWSPDGREVGFFADGKLKRIDLLGGSPQVIVDAATPRGATWGADGRIVLAADFRGGLQIVPALGGTAAVLTTTTGTENSHRWPVFLPDGRHVLFLSQTAEGGTRDDTSSIDVVAADGTGRRTLVVANSSPIYADPGFLMFWRNGTLLAQRLDPRSATLSGEPFPAAQDVAYDQNEMAMATAGGSGRLVYVRGGIAGLGTPTWLDRTGRVLKRITEAGAFECGMALSPDATRLVIGKTQQGANGCDLWMYDMDRDISTRLTFDERNEGVPVFAPDGRSILYAADAGRDLILRLDLGGRGTPQEVFEKADGFTAARPGSLSRDGKWMICSTYAAKTGSDIIRYELDSQVVKPLVATTFTEDSPTLSPDERWIAYSSDRSGQFEVYVESVDGEGQVAQVSASGGERPQWRSDGRELFFYAAPDRVMAVDVLPGQAFRTSAPKELFRAPFAPFSEFVVAPDGQRFIVILSEDRNVRQSLTLISEWRPRN